MPQLMFGASITSLKEEFAMKVFYVLALAAVLLSAGCDNTIYGTPGGTAPLNYLGTWQLTVNGPNSPEFGDLQLVHTGAELSGSVSVSLQPSQPSRPARVSGSVGPDGGFNLQIFFGGGAAQTSGFLLTGRFTGPASAKGTATNRMVNPHTTREFSMRRTGP